jgi:hypothetical protein
MGVGITCSEHRACDGATYASNEGFHESSRTFGASTDWKILDPFGICRSDYISATITSPACHSYDFSWLATTTSRATLLMTVTTVARKEPRMHSQRQQDFFRRLDRALATRYVHEYLGLQRERRSRIAPNDNQNPLLWQPRCVSVYA